MPNIIRQIVGELLDKAPSALPGDQKGIYIQASDGREFLVTRRQMLARFVQETGTRAQRMVKVREWRRAQIVAALGAEQIDPAGIIGEYDDDDATPMMLEVSG